MNIVEPTSTNLEAHRFRGGAVVFPLLHVHDDGESRVHSRRERPPRHVVALEVLRRCLCQTKQRCGFRQDDFRYDQASCKYLPRSCCPTAGTVRHGGTGTCMRVCLCCAYALLWGQWDNSYVEDIYMKPDWEAARRLNFLNGLACIPNRAVT